MTFLEETYASFTVYTAEQRQKVESNLNYRAAYAAEDAVKCLEIGSQILEGNNAWPGYARIERLLNGL